MVAEQVLNWTREFHSWFYHIGVNCLHRVVGMKNARNWKIGAKYSLDRLNLVVQIENARNWKIGVKYFV